MGHDRSLLAKEFWVRANVRNSDDSGFVISFIDQQQIKSKMALSEPYKISLKGMILNMNRQ